MAEYSYDEFGYLRDNAVGYGVDNTNYDTPGERARAQAALQAWEATRDPFEIDGAQTSSGYVDPMYYVNNGLSWVKYVSLPFIAQREAQRLYALATGGRDIAADLYNNVANTASNLVQPTIDALRAAMEKVATGAKNTLLIGAGVVGIVALALIMRK